MLTQLQIENLAIVESASIEFEPGLNAITGETGAGKTILIGALELALGGRASADQVRQGSKVAAVEATLMPPLPRAVNDLIARELELEWEGEEPLTLRREVSARGRSRCFIAGQLVGVADLRRVGEALVDLHGQHEHQSLFRPAAQREALDAFGAYPKKLDAYRAAHEAWRALERRAASLADEARDYEQRLDYLNFQIDEIGEVDPQENEIEALAAEEARLAHAETLAEAAARVYTLLYEGEGDDAPGALARLREAGRQLDRIAELDPAMKDLPERGGEIEALVEDIALTMRGYAGRCEADPARLEEVIARVEAIRRLMRKHAAESETQLRATLERLTAERDRMTLDEEERGEIDARLAEAESTLRAAGQALTEARREAAGKLARHVERTLGRIAMARAKFEIDVAAAPEPGPEGMDRVEFLLAANPGEGMKPLREVASGGELSRTMLAIKTALARRDAIPILVFDEIDAGISGETAARVGDLLAGLAASHQILCITHHAAIAARAGRQVSVRKTTARGRTRMSAVPLDREARLEELARMMGGDAAGAAGRKLAEALLGI